LGNNKLRAVRATSLIEGVPMPPMLVQGLIPRGGLVMISAEPFVGKTFLSLELARSVATGGNFMGKFPTNQGNVLFVEEDSPAWDLSAQFVKLAGAQNDRDRLSILDQTGKVGLTDLEQHCFFLVGQGVNLDTTTGAMDLVQVMKDLGPVEYGREEVETGTDLLILDTMRSLHSGEENDATAMALLLDKLRMIQRETGAAIVLLHHFNKPTKENQGNLSLRLRGSSAILGALDGLIGLTRVNKDGLVRAQILKSRAIQTEGFEFWIAPTDDGVGLIYNDTKGDLAGKLREYFESAVVPQRMVELLAIAKQMFPLKQDNALRVQVQRSVTLLEAQGLVRKVGRGAWQGTGLKAPIAR
jgi:KaiC/GvpD/RAD55 family RecA-like ATPase